MLRIKHATRHGNLLTRTNLRLHSLVVSLNPTVICLEPFAAYHNKIMNMLCAPYVEREDLFRSHFFFFHLSYLFVFLLIHNPNVFISRSKEMVPDYLSVVAT